MSREPVYLLKSQWLNTHHHTFVQGMPSISEKLYARPLFGVHPLGASISQARLQALKIATAESGTPTCEIALGYILDLPLGPETISFGFSRPSPRHSPFRACLRMWLMGVHKVLMW